MLEDASTWLRDQRRTHLSESVVYKRGVVTATISNATPGQTVGDTDEQTGLRMRVFRKDWLIDAADLVLSGSATEPQTGDRIEHTISGTTYVWEVAESPGGTPWRWHDRWMKTYRIACVEV